MLFLGFLAPNLSRSLAAFLAMSMRYSAVKLFAHALPPRLALLERYVAVASWVRSISSMPRLLAGCLTIRRCDNWSHACSPDRCLLDASTSRIHEHNVSNLSKFVAIGISREIRLTSGTMGPFSRREPFFGQDRRLAEKIYAGPSACTQKGENTCSPAILRALTLLKWMHNENCQN